eukprot:TRINITY_DN27043_c0_g1_i1.p1 TRINITY_DN27043_c0_g1~~TRINITY_DN27043_c0_g1_i1.p1  ORF type:complete len:221 (-),score=46.48 TRINITY_DN27043_c0_g1_i1:315-977(-)
MPKGNLWNLSTCNRLVAERTEQHRHERHIRALESTRRQVDFSEPKAHPHLKTKPKTRKLQEDRAAEIQLENRILLQKMLNIDTKPSELVGAMNAGSFKPRSLHGDAQRRDMDRISAENQALLNRLQSTKPSIDPKAWEEEEVDRQALKYRLSQNACRGRASKLRMPAKHAGYNDSRLPRIPYGGGPAQYEDEWAEFTNAQLDSHLKELEYRGANQPALSA